MRIQSTRSGNSAPPSDDSDDISKFEWKKIILRLGVNQAVKRFISGKIDSLFIDERIT